MTIAQLADVALGILALAWIIYRQMTWRAISMGRMWKMPLILGAIGVFQLSQMKDLHRLSTLDIGALVVELLVSLGVGALMGAVAVIRPSSRADGQEPDQPAFQSRTGWVGLALWIVMIAVRVGIDVAASSMGSVLATATGVILVMIAANRLARAFVLVTRVQSLAPTTA
ncbi:hypothetical protein OSC27_12875 [Microbacterium sp. STN6]|uniref:hypothetical protein n=1 Tax=Microbacterium sp. STN6 TaxID=2995588 RepID=UPI002260E266|nr:hypothetical protein [Microbacterium sp. STN6]MCX7523165.1 hypothetical protein [Microbacterium sp. STN6]